MPSIKDCKNHGSKTQSTGAKTPRLPKDSRRTTVVEVCSGCGHEVSRKGK